MNTATESVTARAAAAEIDWIEADGDYLKIHTGKQSSLVRMTMRTLDEKIDRAKFLRIHRSTIVNVDRIEKINLFRESGDSVVLLDGTRLRIGGTYQSRIREFCLTADTLVRVKLRKSLPSPHQTGPTTASHARISG